MLENIFFPIKRTRIAICKLNFSACVCEFACLALPFGEHLHFVFRKSRDFVMFFVNKSTTETKTVFSIRVVERNHS